MTGCPGISKPASLSTPTVPESSLARAPTVANVTTFRTTPEPSSNKKEKSIHVSERALDRLAKARKKGETFSDVIIRLSEAKVTALQRRGEQAIPTSDGRSLIVRIDQDKCMGAESCVSVAPALFALDISRLGGFRRGGEPLGMMDVGEGTLDSDTIIRAAKSCPYGSIYVRDANSGDELAG